jgi:hypothetical protein
MKFENFLFGNENFILVAIFELEGSWRSYLRFVSRHKDILSFNRYSLLLRALVIGYGYRFFVCQNRFYRVKDVLEFIESRIFFILNKLDKTVDLKR